MKVFDAGDHIYIGNHSSVTDEDGNPVGAFADADGTPADPTAVALLVEAGDGALTTYTYGGSPALLREAVGRYYAARTPQAGEAGLWAWRLVGTGAVEAAAQGRFYVRPARP